MPWYVTIIICLFSILILGSLFIGYVIAYSMYHPYCLTLAETRIKESERTPDLLAEFDQWERSPYEVSSRFGYSLQCYYFPRPLEFQTLPSRLCVIPHGYTYSHHGGIKYAHLMRRHGFDVILYDERFHGASGGKSCSLGFYEAQDLETVITDAFKRFGDSSFLGVYGESMGAVSALIEQEHDARVRFVISDCAFADLSLLVSSMIKRRHHLPHFPFVRLGDCFFRMANGVSFSAIKPMDAVKNAKIPILFIHGRDDAFVPCEHSQILYDACSSPKKLYLAGNGARHAESFRKNREEYTRILDDFLREYVFTESPNPR